MGFDWKKKLQEEEHSNTQITLSYEKVNNNAQKNEEVKLQIVIFPNITFTKEVFSGLLLESEVMATEDINIGDIGKIITFNKNNAHMIMFTKNNVLTMVGYIDSFENAYKLAKKQEEKILNLLEVNTMEKISISAEAFKEGGTIPAEYTCDGSNVSPALSWRGIPANAKSIALIMDDPDAPMGTFVHWVLFNIPPDTTELPEGVPKNRTLDDGSSQGMTDFGRVGYGGPCPPGGTHRYYFKVYALDTMLELQPGATKKQLENAMKGHVLAQGELMGKYER